MPFAPRITTTRQVREIELITTRTHRDRTGREPRLYVKNKLRNDSLRCLSLRFDEKDLATDRCDAFANACDILHASTSSQTALMIVRFFFAPHYLIFSKLEMKRNERSPVESKFLLKEKTEWET